MFDFSALPLTPDDARAARNYLGFSQAKAAKESGLPDHKIKRFESGNYIPDEQFLNALRAFFEDRGYEFQDTPKPGAKARGSGQVFPAGVIGEAVESQYPQQSSKPQLARFHHMRIAIEDEREMGELLDMIEANEEKAAELARGPAEDGFFGGHTEATQRRHVHIVRLLSDNGTMFAKLFGRDIGGKPAPDVLVGKKPPATNADLLHKVQADIHLASAGDARAKDRQKAQKTKPPTGSLLQAIGLS